MMAFMRLAASMGFCLNTALSLREHLFLSTVLLIAAFLLYEILSDRQIYHYYKQTSTALLFVV